MEKSSSDKAALEERTPLKEVDGVPQGAEGGQVDLQFRRKSSSTRSSRKSFRLDYRLEEEVTKSCRDKQGRWTNPWPTWRFPSYSMLLRFLLVEKNHSNVPTSEEALDSELPVMEPFFVRNPELSDSHPGLRVTWLGHASLLVEMEGMNILTDPIFSQRASPVQFMGPKRYRGPPCTVEKLPRIDAVLISHSHYDHLDAGSVASLNARFGGELRWFVPLGLMDWLVKMGCENVMELDWWEENCVPGHDNVTFVCSPAQHWSKRTAWDDYKSLWSSWSVLGPSFRFFFAGDTGYCPAFQEIGRRFGPFDLAAIPIGAYHPRYVMRGQHVDPEEAVQIHQDLQAKQSVAIHWGTFALAYEGLKEGASSNWRVLFNMHDTDSDGIITLDEYRKVVEELLSKSGTIGQDAAKAIADAAMLEVASTNVPQMGPDDFYEGITFEHFEQMLQRLELESRMHIRFLDANTATMHCGNATM